MDSKIFYQDIDENTKHNENYRKVVHTGKKLQLVYMSIKPLDSIHMEIHPETEQFIKIEQGNGLAIVDGTTFDLKVGICIIIPMNTPHEIINTSKDTILKLYTIYSPIEHPDSTIQLNNPDMDYKKKYIKYKKRYLDLKKKITEN